MFTPYFCRTAWARLLGQNLASIMRVMKFSSQRGNSHYDPVHLSDPHRDNPLLEFQEPSAADLTDFSSMLPFCHFPRPGQHIMGGFKLSDINFFGCRLFSPTFTDQGICYSYNALPTGQLYKENQNTELESHLNR